MTVAKPASLTLEEFLKLPETKPASEYIDGEVIQKIMPKTRHSRLQAKLIDAINEVTEVQQIAYAFPELRCTFGSRSVVPDIAVFRWQNIKLDENGELIDSVLVAPDWTIEILSPDQSSNRVMGNILHCLKHDCQLGWLIDPGDRSVLVFQPQQQPELFHQDDKLVVLKGVELDLTANQLFSWLKMRTE
ncbi:Uma2 family endonuclease [Leptolyngbya sp. FACHB-671]|uniref:Uma2 family endonuclease n=1 Tax=Leptolyngbya sp. FACHB-671 TaxID=2692812 RepID=UPI001685F131|nr:Uma2 family endonuclease [Leptolyngbya sp. FACHB-671]MBD2069282.1 Uma2 family endonuclease [Leptolyngbya sp. FACHB-671]